MRVAESLRRLKSPAHRQKLAEAGLAFQKAHRAQRAEEAPLHPKEERVIRLRARENVVEDLAQLRELAKMRTYSGSKSGRYLAQCEFEFIEKLLTRLEEM